MARKREQGRTNAAYNARHQARVILGRLRARSRNKGQPFDLEESDIQTMLDNATCVYCSASIESNHGASYGEGRKVASRTSFSVDKIDPALGYVKGNVVSACWACNCSKGIATYAEFRRHVIAMYLRLAERPEAPNTQ